MKDTAGALFRTASIEQTASARDASVSTQNLLPSSRVEPPARTAVDRGVPAVAKPAEPDKAEPLVVARESAALEAMNTDEMIFLVRFGFDSAELDENSMLTIERAIEAIQDGFEGVTVVAGYSDPLGNSAYNLKLSRKRAQAVADSLLASGVPGDRLRVEGRGAYAVLHSKANDQPPELGRIAQIIIEESDEW